MPEKYLSQLIKQGENQQLDFKFEINDTKKIARTLVAFANTDGGILLLGVKDNGNIVGVRSDEEVYMIETANHLYCKPHVEYTASAHLVSGKTVVEIKVEPSQQKPHFAPGKDEKWTPFIRVNDENLVANQVMVKVWERKTQSKGIFLKFTDAEKQLLTYMEQNGNITFSKACRVAKVNHKKVENILVNFIVLGIIKPVFENHKVIYQITTTGNFTF